MFDESTRSLYCLNVLRVRKIYFKITVHGKKQAQETQTSGYRAGSWDGKQHTVPPRSQLCAAMGPQLSEVTQA